MNHTGFKEGLMLVIGGAKSGKSRFALDTCNRSLEKRIFLATARAEDQEMEERIRRHQAERGPEWVTVEEPLDLAARIRKLDNEDTLILLDCLTLWLSNLFMKYGDDQQRINKEIDDLVAQLSHVHGTVVAVANEVGAGIVPDNSLARRYRDTAGFTSQSLAAVARRVVQIVAGLPILLKDE
jgi:adenosylcobinamide kinase/adenosylcobinamide-phosphate guanylyltransferase